MDANLALAIIIVLQVLFYFDALNYGCLVAFRKTLDHPESCMRYIFTYTKIFTREVFSKEIKIILRYACNNFYALC